jgi:hypothetical protein
VSPNQNFVFLLISSMLATWPVHLVLLDLVTLIVFSDM